ncbi:MAG: XRE family transcriptional regulator [Bifidobacteriaceae bacterium]|nr:XRE family transcriptional regulator [Bifidobacteriaceae bacterium]
MNITAVATWTEGWWAIEIPEVPHVYSQARTLDRVAGMALDAVSLHTGRPQADFAVRVDPRLSPEEEAAMARATAAKQAASETARAASVANRAAADTLHAKHSTRDVAYLMGITTQRVSRLLSPV